MPVQWLAGPCAAGKYGCPAPLHPRVPLPGASPRGTNRVIRGGSWNNNPQNLRSANRNRNTPDNRNNNLGFRVVSSPPTPHPMAGAVAFTDVTGVPPGC
ncbi:MAG: SUMF1/EgtB/PvdO family nonheme iron enzyme [Candidatus Sumerlaeia bacterium]|nr:SUMF1/EgtB/PvdO family nonheme iron enzyme [Candidatus Sumerlaeia bacterium]